MDLSIFHAMLQFAFFKKVALFFWHNLRNPGIVLAILCVLEWRAGSDWRRYVSRSFVIDVLHYLMYGAGIFAVLVYNPMVAVLQPRLAFLQFDLLEHIPALLAYILFLIYADFISYWYHRLLHANSFLWAFHSVHHAAPQLTGLSVARIHFVEILGASLVTLVFILLPLGSITTSVWPVLGVVWVMKFLEGVHHADLPWRFGPLSRLLVSPVFHAIHHSTDPSYFNKNYGINFSIWDYLFGTAAESQSRPTAYGGMESVGLTETFTGLVLVPFKNAWRCLSWPRRAAPQGVSSTL